jgi:hypothetical protein
MSYKMLQPEDRGMKDLIRLHGADKSHGEAAPSSELYTPTEYEMAQIPKLIERFSGMEAKLKNIKTKIVSRDDAEKIAMKETLDTLKKFNVDPSAQKDIIKQMQDTKVVSAAAGIYSAYGGTIYLVKESIEETRDQYCAVYNIKKGSPEAKKEERMIVLFSAIHEVVHLVVLENNPHVGNSRLEGMVEGSKIISEVERIKQKEFGGVEDVLKVMEATKALKSINDRMNTFRIYNEAIAHDVGAKVMGKLGHSHDALVLLTYAKEFNTEAQKGTVFLKAIGRKKPKENPIAYTIKHPPTSMRHIELPDEYLKDREAGKV